MHHCQDMDESALIERHVDVLFGRDRRDRLVATNEPEPEAAPRVFVARGRLVARIWLRADVPAAMATKCESAAAMLPRWNGLEPDARVFEPLRLALAGWGEPSAEHGGPALRFGVRVDPPRDSVVLIDASNEDVLDARFPYTRTVLGARSPVVAVVRDGSAVSACYAARSRPDGCEAGVDTVDAWRGRGFGGLVVAAWRAAVEDAGRIALYSTSWDNTASRGLAARLGLIAYADTHSFD